jgi:predicted nucleotidyltransferase
MVVKDRDTGEFRLPGLSAEDTLRLVPKGSIIVGYRGSQAHNTYITPTDPNSIDDIDIMSAFVPPLSYYFGLSGVHKKDRGTIEVMLDPWDSVSYEIRKFTWLLLKANPNVLMMLWLRENHYLYIHPLGKRILENRDIFVGKHAYEPFIGYAHSQLHRMEHYKYHGRMGAKRKKLVEKYGYDTKNASHLIRLLRMGTEFLSEGKMHVFRRDSRELKAIKTGEWSLERVKEESDKWFNLAHEAYVRSPLPVAPDKQKAEALAASIIRDWHRI